MSQKFLRRSWNKLSKLGKGRKRIQRWRKPTGRDNKMREKRKGYSPLVSIGYRSDKENRGKLKLMTPVTIMNVSELSNLEKGQIAKLGKVGMKKLLEIKNAGGPLIAFGESSFMADMVDMDSYR